MPVSLSAYYNKNADEVEVNFFETNVNGVTVPITSGLIELLQNNQKIQEVEIDNRANFVLFHRPTYINNLQVRATLGGLDAVMIPVSKEKPLQTAVAFPAPNPELIGQFLPRSTDVVTQNNDFFSPFILNVDFNKDPVHLVYAGGNRIEFDYQSQLVIQDVNQFVPAPKYCEVGTVNLLPADQTQAFKINYPFGGANIVSDDGNEFGYPALIVHALGSQADKGLQTLGVELATPIAVSGPITAQFYIGFDVLPTAKTFQLVSTIKNDAGVVQAQNSQTFNVADFLNQLTLISTTLNGVGNFSCSLNVINVLPGDIFNITMLLPQVTLLGTVTSFTPNTRVADTYQWVDAQADHLLTTFELEYVVAENLPCFLFDAGSIRASYDGYNVIFNVNGKVIQGRVSMKDHNSFSFTFDVTNNELMISVDDVVLVTDSGFTYLPINKTVFIGSDAFGKNQINGRLNRWKVMRQNSPHGENHKHEHQHK